MCMRPPDEKSLYAGAQQAFGKKLETHWNFAAAEVIVSLDGDFLDAGPQQAGASGAWAEARRKLAAQGKLLTMHAVAPAPGLTYGKSDYHLPVAQRDLLPLAQSLLNGTDHFGDGALASWRSAVVNALGAARGHGIVLTGTHQSAELHAIVHRINTAFSNTGKLSSTPIRCSARRSRSRILWRPCVAAT